MRDYGKVHTTFWSSQTISALSDDGRLLALYLMTSPHTTIAGVFRLPDGYVSEDLRWTSERVAKGFAELFANGFANRCETTKWVWIVKHLVWNPPENPNQRKAALKCADQVPSQCAWKVEFSQSIAEMFGRTNGSETSNPSETLPKPFLNQEQEQEQEQERGLTRSAPKSRGSRLPTGWEPTPEDIESAKTAGLVNGRLAAELEKFRDYWAAVSGQKGVKADWHATWRNWCRKAVEYAPAKQGSSDPFAGAA